MKITVHKAFRYSTNGYDIVNVNVGEIDIEERFAQYAIKQGYATETGAKTKKSTPKSKQAK